MKEEARMNKEIERKYAVKYIPEDLKITDILDSKQNFLMVMLLGTKIPYSQIELQI